MEDHPDLITEHHTIIVKATNDGMVICSIDDHAVIGTWMDAINLSQSLLIQAFAAAANINVTKTTFSNYLIGMDTL